MTMIVALCIIYWTLVALVSTEQEPQCPEIALGNGIVTYFGGREIYTFAFFTCNEGFELGSVTYTECELNQK
ncbi:hypothetical protein DPMN_153673 [Dreissena polymorpha]|uniref:Sushi domain-containing protein n=1 Tax=Dreissena polymorpha TaxID=45954 RepID=A0A9D4FJL1_DREPO|nr:hypothetical protein DPMN_153673 [Dreissena polymorpha]